MNHSIRHHLLKYLAIALLVTSLAIAAFTYGIAGEELDELYDENMEQLAEIVLTRHSIAHYQASPPEQEHLILHGEEEFLIQVWNHTALPLYTSHPLIHFPLQKNTGYGTTHFDGRRWRYYNAEKNGVTVQLSQPLDERKEAIMEVSSKFLIPLLLQIPLLGFLIWIAVGKSLKPIETLSSDIAKRDAYAMDPLITQNLPTEIKPLAEALNKLLERLELALKVQRRFTADAAHELRTPLTAVQLQLDVFKRSQSEQEKHDALSKLGAGIKRSIHVVKQLLSLAHQDPELNIHKKEPLDLVTLVGEVVMQCAELAKQKYIDLAFTHSNTILPVMGNNTSLRILMENLLDNAIRYTQEGGKVTVNLSQDADGLTLRVIDNGPGIPLAEQAHVFDRFYRVIGTKESGSGLGLAIVKRIAEQHNATIRLTKGMDNKGLEVSLLFKDSAA